MKTLFISIGLVAVLFLSVTMSVEAQKKATNNPDRGTATGWPVKCSVVVRNDLMPNMGVVVVGCDTFGIHLGDFTDMQGKRPPWPSNGGIIVFDADMNVLLKWEACTACGGIFSHFAGVKKVKGRNALMVQLINGPRLETGITSTPIVPLYFDGTKFRFID